MSDTNFIKEYFFPDASIGQINTLIETPQRLSLLYIYSPDCIACQDAKIVIDLFRSTFRSEVPVATINALAMPDVWDAFGLKTLPSFLMVGNGEAIAEQSGSISLQILMQMKNDAQRTFSDGVKHG